MHGSAGHHKMDRTFIHACAVIRPVRVYVDGCFDMMHYGHANALRQVKDVISEIHPQIVLQVTSVPGGPDCIEEILFLHPNVWLYRCFY